ncbi:MAG: universal stress protein [Saprospiraceae bacterium]|nr:universal stress protein [Saprospiraceae bacterium]
MARLIVPTDYSSTAEKALDQALLLAKKHNDEVELLHIVIVPPSGESPKIWEYITGEEKQEKAKLEGLAQARIKALKLPETTRWRAKVVYADRFLPSLIGRFEKTKAKLVVMGTTGVGGLANKIFGSNTANLIEKAEVPVLAIPPSWDPTDLQKLEFCIAPDQVDELKSNIKRWANWFGVEPQVVHFANVANAGTGKDKDKSPFQVKAVLTVPEEPLYQDLVEYSTGLKNTALCMFVHERLTVFERIFNKSITGLVAGHVQIPMLALPLKED